MADDQIARANPSQSDETVSPTDSLTVINAIREFRKEAHDAKRVRMLRNRVNRNAYLGQQDWSHKESGQSREFVPKTPVAVEQFTGFAKRALTQFGAWFDVSLSRGNKSPISEGDIRNLLNCFLDDLFTEDNVKTPFPTLLTDGLKVGALESLMIFKIHGQMMTERRFAVEPGSATFDPETGQVSAAQEELVMTDLQSWRLRIDLIRPEDYYPDPTGRGLYEIQRSEHDLHYIRERTTDKGGPYDPKVVEDIQQDFKKEEDQRRRRDTEEAREHAPPSFRKRVVLDEFWGSILNTEGEVVQRNIIATVANDRFLIRPPEPNPFWHQESPFVATPLIRVPFSVWHKALFDHATQLNMALNEMFNLILDGGIASVWGIKQLRIDELDDPRQVSDGVKQGQTLLVKNTLPVNAKVVETVATGEVPRDAMAVFEALSREFAAAALSSEIKLGSLPPKQVKATEIIELSQSQAVTLDAIISDIERAIERILRKAFLTVLQNIDDIASDRVISAIGIEAAFKMAQMSPAVRFATFAVGCNIKVHGLSAVASRTRDFQKFMALLQSVVANPILLQAFFKRFSGNRILSHIIKSLNVNPETLERDEEELERVTDDFEELQKFQELTSGAKGGSQGGGGAGLSAQNVGEPQLPAEIAQQANPLTGIKGP